jgi:formate--tetrahydrofolate ligase
MKHDIEIAQEAKIRPVVRIAEKLGIPADELETYGKYRQRYLYILLIRRK